MNRSRLRLIAVVALVLMCASWPFGARAGAGAYVATALTIAVVFLRFSERGSPYRSIAVAQVLFSGGWLAEVFLQALDVAEVLYTLAYVPVLLAAWQVARGRVGRLEAESMLEAVGLALLGSAAFLEFQAAIDTRAMENPALLPVVGVVLLLMALSYFGRGSDRSMGGWMLAALLTVVLEVADSLSSMAVIIRLTESFSALPYIVLLLTFANDRHATFVQRSDLLARRPFGRLQLLGVATWLLVPFALIVRRLMLDDTDRWEPLAFVGVALVVVGIARIRLLVRLRDWSYEIEARLRSLGDELVRAGSADEAWGSFYAVLRDVTGGAGAIVPQSSDTDVSSSLSVDIPGTDSRIVLSGRSRIRAELRDQLEAAANQLALALRSMESREAEHRRRSEYRFKSMLTLASDLVFAVNADTRRIELISPSVRRVLGFSEESRVDTDLLSSFHAPDRRTVERIVFEGDHPLGAGREVRMVDATGDHRWFTLASQDLTDDAEVGSIVVVAADVTERKIAELQLQRSETRNRAMVDQAQEVLALVDEELSFNFVSAAVGSVLGLDAEQLVGKDVRSILTKVGGRELDSWLRRPGALEAGEPFEVEALAGDGHARVMRVRVATVPAFAGGGFAISTRDVTDEKVLSERLADQQSRDQLTGLPNRLAFQAWLAASSDHRRRDQSTAVLSIDLDDFRLLNDAVGTERGDELLRTIGERLRMGVRAEDQIARYAGDQFVVGTIVEDAAEARRLAQRLIDLIGAPVEIAGQTRTIGSAIGIAVLDAGEPDATVLLRQANLALGVAKRADGSRAMTYEASMAAEADEHFALIADLGDAIENKQISLSYQPVIDLGSSRVASVEALARWEHPTRGWVSPGVFIPIAEKHGHIIGLGRLVLGTALRQLIEWDGTVVDADRLRMAVNVSMLQLTEPGEVDVLLEIIRDSGIEPKRLTIEVTETNTADDATFVRDQLERFRSAGCAVAIDDFGTGVAGISHLRDMPFDIIKIDKSYIDALATQVEGDAVDLIANLIEISHNSGAVVVAEGVETSQQSSTLVRLGCDYGQGFYYGRPVPPAVLVDEFAAGRDGNAPFVIVAKSQV